MTTLTQQLYKEKVAPALKEKFQYANVMEVPTIEKITINVGAGTKTEYNLDAVAENLAKITGQQPVQTLAKKSISNFKIRDGQPIGLKVTLRGPRMYEFIDRLVHITFPRVHDFRGLSSKAFDRQGNYAIGFKDQLAFPEIKAEGIDQLHGLEVVITTSAPNAEQGYELLKGLGFPIQERKTKKKS